MKKTLTILSLVSLILLSCSSNVNDKAKIEKAILDSIKKADSLKNVFKLDSLNKESAKDSTNNMKNGEIVNSTNSKENQKSVTTTVTYEKKLIGNEYGEFHFSVPCGVRGWSFTINFFSNTNTVFATETYVNSQLGNVSQGSSNGTFTVDKVNNDFKYVTCTINDGQIYKLKYSISKKKWILLNACDAAPEVEAV